MIQIIQPCDGSEGLCLEASNGVKMQMSSEDIRLVFKKEKITLLGKVKLLVLLFPSSDKLASVFQELGVDHILAFEALSD
jgi:hypothetical protein